MGLIRGVARTAVIAGTATAVSNNVSRRQQRRWSEQEAQQQPQPTYPAVPQQAPEPVAEQVPAEDELTASLNRLADLHARGVLSDEEFAAAKAKLLGL
jgi:hemolysin activation/secretion protein